MTKMSNVKNVLSISLVLLGVNVSFSQNLTGRIIDSKTGESIAYANIKVNETENLISNSDGYFSLPESKTADNTSLLISYLGYVNRKITVADLKQHQLIVKLDEGSYTLETVNISNKKPDPDFIMQQVKKNLPNNYKVFEKQAAKRTIFWRDALAFNGEDLKVKITKSPSRTKGDIERANAELAAFCAKMIAHPPKQYNDILCNYYSASKRNQEGKSTFTTKLEKIKATNLRDEKRMLSLDNLDEALEKVCYKYLDSTRYYKAKTGLFTVSSGLVGSNDSISSSEKFNEQAKIRRRSTLQKAKDNLSYFMILNSLRMQYHLTFVDQPEMYKYTYEGGTYTGNNEFVYVLSFTPRKGDAIYKGKLYISERDYAVLRTEYELVEGEILDGFNVKMLFGVKTRKNVSKGILIFRQKADKSGYYLHYGSNEVGEYVYIDRPLKFVDVKKKGHEVAFDVRIVANSVRNTEFLTIDQADISEAFFDNIKEKDFEYIKLREYDPKIWKGDISIEPLEEMKQYRVSE